MPVIELAPMGELRVDAAADLLIGIANRLPEDLSNVAGMAVLILDVDGGIEVSDCGLTHLQLIGLMEECKLTVQMTTMEVEEGEDE